MSRTIYVIVGSYGEFEDRRSWNVGYELSEDIAKVHVAKLNEDGERLFKRAIEFVDEPGGYYVDIEEAVKRFGALDKKCGLVVNAGSNAPSSFHRIKYRYEPLNQFEL